VTMVIARPISIVFVGLLLTFGIGACAGPAPSPALPVATPAAPEQGQVEPIPTPDRAGLERCMAAAGFTVHPARTGSNGVYSWERSSYFTWEAGDRGSGPAAAAACGERFDPVRPKSADELLEIYQRWLLERRCLMSLGFHPKAPPSFPEFRATWTTGPWMPIDGVRFDQLGGRARDTCGLEMIP